MALAGLLIAYGLAVLSVRPFGNMLYGGDDWGYGWSVERMVLDGKLVASNWLAAAAVPQVLWGTAFCKVFGLSWLVMNMATLVFSILGPVLVYWIGIELGFSSKFAALVGFFAVINPLYLGFAGSFMSDTYYVVLMLACVLVYVRGLRRRRVSFLIVGAILASVALLQRQIGIATPAAVVGSLLVGVLSKRLSVREGIRMALGAAAIPALSAGVFRAFPDAFGGTTHTQIVKLNSAAVWSRFLDFGESFSNGYTTLLYVGAFLVPLAVSLLPVSIRALRSIASRRTAWITGVLVGCALLALGFGLRGHLAIRVHGEFFHPLAIAPFAEAVWKALVFLGSLILPLFSVLFFLSVKRSLSTPKSSAARPLEPELDDIALVNVFLALSLLLHVTLVATFIAFFNNYFLPLVPLASLLFASLLQPFRTERDTRWLWLCQGAAAVFAFVWSTLNVDTMLRYVEADHRLTERLIASGIPSRRIFGYPGAYARRHYAIADAETLRWPWGMFSRLRSRCQYTIIAAGTPFPARFYRRVRTETYRTLAGERSLEVRVQAARRPGRRPWGRR